MPTRILYAHILPPLWTDDDDNDNDDEEEEDNDCNIF